MRVAVLGAYGTVGRRLVAAAGLLGHQVTAAGRDHHRLAQVHASDHVVLGVGDTRRLRTLAQTHDVVVNTTGREDPHLVSIATAEGAAFMDISAERTHLEQLGRMETPLHPIAAGVGLAPGLTNLLAVTVPGDGPIHIGIVGGVGERHGKAARRWVWETAGQPVTSAGNVQRVYRSARRFHVPGLGNRTLLRAAFGEQDQLAADLARPVSTWLGLDPPVATPLLGIAGLIPAAATGLDLLSSPVSSRLSTYDRWAVAVTSSTMTTVWASGRGQSDATASIAALCLEPLRRAAPGVYATHQLVTLTDLRAGLARSGIKTGMDPHQIQPGPE